jgi:DNA replication protein DnaT
MARIRTIKPEFWRDESLASVSSDACLLAIGLLNHCDDEGFFNANPKLVESDIFPLRELSNTTTVLIQELCEIGYIALYQGSDKKTYGHIVNFEKHQVINKKTTSKIKDLCNLLLSSDTTPVVLPTGKERKGKEMERNGDICPPSG